MSALLEFECRVPVGGYRVLSFDERKFCGADTKYNWDDSSVSPPEDATEDERYLLSRWGMGVVPAISQEMFKIGIEPEVREILEPQSEPIRCFDLFDEATDLHLEFANASKTSEEVKALADRFGPLRGEGPEYVDAWEWAIMEMRSAVRTWNKAEATGDFSRMVRFIPRQRSNRQIGREVSIDANLLLSKDPVSGAGRLCIRPRTLLDALWTKLALAIDGSESLRTCVECKEWFTIKSGQGRSDKKYCSNACRMRTYRKHKGTQ